jgi:hypothetical protein
MFSETVCKISPPLLLCWQDLLSDSYLGDLWGPLILCLALAITLSAEAPADQAVAIFTGVFVIVWLGAAVVTLNAKVLGGAV